MSNQEERQQTPLVIGLALLVIGSAFFAYYYLYSTPRPQDGSAGQEHTQMAADFNADRHLTAIRADTLATLFKQAYLGKINVDSIGDSLYIRLHGLGTAALPTLNGRRELLKVHNDFQATYSEDDDRLVLAFKVNKEEVPHTVQVPNDILIALVERYLGKK